MGFIEKGFNLARCENRDAGIFFSVLMLAGLVREGCDGLVSRCGANWTAGMDKCEIKEGERNLVRNRVRLFPRFGATTFSGIF